MKKNEWTFVTSMVEPHYGHAGTVHGDLMYISGMDKQNRETATYHRQRGRSSFESEFVHLNRLHFSKWPNDYVSVIWRR